MLSIPVLMRSCTQTFLRSRRDQSYPVAACLVADQWQHIDRCPLGKEPARTGLRGLQDCDYHWWRC